MPERVRILGVDPGSRVTGYGVIELDPAGRTRYVASGCIRCGQGALPDRLAIIHADLSDLIDAHAPTESALEAVFVARSAGSALKLGQARGAAIVALARHGLGIAEYAPRAVKLAVCGHGGATKQQVQHMVRVLLSLPGTPPADAADALAIALCHAHARGSAAAALAARVHS